MEFPTLEAGWMLLMGWLYQQTEISPESLTAEEVQRFIRTHTDVLDGAVDTALKEVPLDDISVQRLKESNYVFSGIKTFHELNETFPSLLDEEGNRKPFNQFLMMFKRYMTPTTCSICEQNTTSPRHPR